MEHTTLISEAVLKGSEVKASLSLTRCPTIPTTIKFHKGATQVKIAPIKQGTTNGNTELHRNTLWSYYRVSIYTMEVEL
tara:strand:- start:1911 stop:2147 length:237 start_codon:yes stop_codon:yes gene_type:complete